MNILRRFEKKLEALPATPEDLMRERKRLAVIIQAIQEEFPEHKTKLISKKVSQAMSGMNGHEVGSEVKKKIGRPKKIISNLRSQFIVWFQENGGDKRPIPFVEIRNSLIAKGILPNESVSGRTTNIVLNAMRAGGFVKQTSEGWLLVHDDKTLKEGILAWLRTHPQDPPYHTKELILKLQNHKVVPKTVPVYPLLREMKKQHLLGSSSKGWSAPLEG